MRPDGTPGPWTIGFGPGGMGVQPLPTEKAAGTPHGNWGFDPLRGGFVPAGPPTLGPTKDPAQMPPRITPNAPVIGSPKGMQAPINVNRRSLGERPSMQAPVTNMVNRQNMGVAPGNFEGPNPVQAARGMQAPPPQRGAALQGYMNATAPLRNPQ
jgi:hypothetical protein